MKKRSPIIAGNWKMHKTVGQSIATAVALKSQVYNITNCEIIIAPVFTALSGVSSRLEGSNIKIAGQNLAAEAAEGAYTGEVSAEMLKDVGCSYVIIGHSERRQYYGETNLTVSQKIHRALQAGLIPIMCCGETLSERDAKKQEIIVQQQITEGMANLTASDLFRIVIAYEPIWAIGTGRAATPDIAQVMHHFIRSVVVNKFGSEVAQKLRILYGGSVNSNNIQSFLHELDIDGALVGGASLEADSFASIIRSSNEKVFLN